MRTADTDNGYGWISIALHWLTAVIVLTMFVIGTMSQSADEAGYVRLVHLHTTIGIAAYPLLWGRIGWRFAVGHPGRLPKQSAFFFAIGKYFHFVMLLAIAVMLLSGPLMVWTAGERIQVFGLAIPGPFGKLEAVQHALRAVHGYHGVVHSRRDDRSRPRGLQAHRARSRRHLRQDHDRGRRPARAPDRGAEQQVTRMELKMELPKWNF